MSAGRSSTNKYFVDEPFSDLPELPNVIEGGLREGARRSWHSFYQRRNIVVILLVVAYVAWFVHLNLESYYTYGEPPFDLSIFDQGMWLISHFHVPFVTIMDEISLATMRRSCCISSRRSSTLP